MITAGKKWHYLAVRSLSALLRGITSSNNEYFYCLNCFHSYRTLNKLEKHGRVCNNHDYYHVDMPEAGKSILKYSSGDKSLKVPFIIYADLECLLKKEQSCQNNPKNSSTPRKAKDKPSGYSLSLNCSFDETKNRRKMYRRKDLKELATEITNYKEKEMIPSTDKEIKSYVEQKVCHICKEKFSYDKNKKSEYHLYHKVRDHCHYTGKFRGAAHNICNLRHKVPKKIPIVFHNGSTYDYHFIIKQLAEDFKGQFECLGENTEKYITFSVPIKEDDNSKKITYKLKFIDSYRFMQSKLSDLVDNLSKINKKGCSKCMRKKLECDYIGFKDNRLRYKCKKCKKNSLSQ